jgi:hypothetical protein
MHVVRTQSGITFKCPNTKDQHFSFEESDKMNPYDELTDDFIQSELCPHLGQFKRLKTIVLVSRGGPGAFEGGGWNLALKAFGTG